MVNDYPTHKITKDCEVNHQCYNCEHKDTKHTKEPCKTCKNIWSMRCAYKAKE